MKEARWLSSAHLYTMLDYLAQQPGNHRRIRLFACACCRRVWHMLQLEAARRIVELAEAYADGEVSETELQMAYNSSDFHCYEPDFLFRFGVTTALSACVADAIQAARQLGSATVNCDFIAQNTSRDQAHDFILSPRNGFGLGMGVKRNETEFALKKQLLRDIFGNPFRKVTFKSRWRNATTIGLAREMYTSRDFFPMPILADALEDIGCDNAEILRHCRGGGPHVRGCWIVDRILEK